MRSRHRDTGGTRLGSCGKVEGLGEQLGLLHLGGYTDGKLLDLTKIRWRRKE